MGRAAAMAAAMGSVSAAHSGRVSGVGSTVLLLYGFPELNVFSAFYEKSS